MRKLILTLFLASFFSAIGTATPVDFTSLGSLSCNGVLGCAGGGPAMTFTNAGATITISYTAGSESDLDAPASPLFAGTNYGQLQVNCTVCAGMTAVFDLSGTSLALGVNQGTDPFNDSDADMFTGTFSGSLTVTNGSSFGGSALVSFIPLAASLSSGPVTVNYFLQQPVNPPDPPGGYLLSIGNVTTFQGAVNLEVADTGIPEPGSMVLMGAGLCVLGLFGRRRMLKSMS